MNTDNEDSSGQTGEATGGDTGGGTQPTPVDDSPRDEQAKKITEREQIFADAINAANEVLFKRGITDRIVGEIGLIQVETAKTAPASEATIAETYKCSCWDCATPGCHSGPCCCMGPACHQP